MKGNPAVFGGLVAEYADVVEAWGGFDHVVFFCPYLQQEL